MLRFFVTWLKRKFELKCKYMEELVDLIKQKFNIKNLRITDVVYNKKEQRLYLTFLSDEILEEKIREEIINICKQKTIENVYVKFARNLVDEFVLRHFVKDYLTTNFKTFATLFNFENIKIDVSDAKTPVLTFLLTKELYEIFESSCRLALLKYLDEQFFANFNIMQQIVEDMVDADEILKKRQKLMLSEPKQESAKIIFNDVCDLIGSNKSKSAMPISEIKGEMQGINVCGTISFFKERTYTKERKGVEREKKYYNFLLSDGTGKISVTVFATVASTPKLQKLCDQTKVLIYGYTELYNDRLSLRVKSLALVGDYKLKKPEQKFKSVPTDYQVVFPKKYNNFTQINLLDVVEEKQENADIDQFLLDNDIVVFDLETTGLNPVDEKITEIGAVKLVKGRMMEYFTTFVNPQKPIPEKIVKKTGITDEDVANAPTIGEVIGDFYKFCKNSILIAYNSDFDIGFIKVESKPYGYYFDNKVLDAMNLVYKSNIPVRNLKLSSALAVLGIVNKGAHRAYNDAEATAKLVIKLGKYLKDI